MMETNDSNELVRPQWNVLFGPGAPFFTILSVATVLSPPICPQYQKYFQIFRFKQTRLSLIFRIALGVPSLYTGINMTHYTIQQVDLMNEYASSSPKILEKGKYELITDGYFQFTRHPMYFGSFLTLFGASILLNNGIIFISTLLYCLWVDRYVAPIEEHGCVQFFGDEYKEYMDKTNRWYYL